MSSTCISSNSHYDPTPVPIARRACYENLYKGPESDARFLKPMSSGGGRGEVRVVDSRSCRQMYLRSAYTFSRATENDKDVKERAKKCLGRVRDRAAQVYRKGDKTYNKVMKSNSGRTIKDVVIVRKVKHFSCASLLSMVRRMLACTAKVDVHQ